MTRIASVLVLIFAMTFPTFAAAGSSEDGNPQFPPAEVAAFANRVQQDLAARGRMWPS